MNTDTEFAGQEEQFDPCDLDAIFASANPDDEYIVKVGFSYCDVRYSGYKILTCKELGELLLGLRSGVQIGTPNMPCSWYEEFDIGLLEGAFSIHSADPADVNAMRSLFGECVGETSLFESVLEAAPKIIDLTKAREFIENDNVDLCAMNAITEDAAEALANYEGSLLLYGLTELSDAAAKALAKHQGTLDLDGLTELSDASAKALAKHQGDLSLNGLTALSDAAAQALAKHQGDLSLNGLTELSDAATEALAKLQGHIELFGLSELTDAAAEAFAKHQGGLHLSNEIEISDSAAEMLSRKPDTINNEDPAMWVKSLRS